MEIPVPNIVHLGVSEAVSPVVEQVLFNLFGIRLDANAAVEWKEVIDAVVARCGGTIRPGHTPHYICVGFGDRETALRAAACYDFASEVAVCLPNEYLSLDE